MARATEPTRSAPAAALAAAPASGGRRARRRPALAIVGALAIVVVVVAGALGTGIVKLPGAGTEDDKGEPAAPSGPVQSPPPVDNLATPAQGTLTLGDASPVQTLSLGTTGASPTVSAPGKPWDGLAIDISADSWPGATLQISAQPIASSSFGSLVTPISPLYTISGAEGMAPMPVTLKIPAGIPDDSFAMGFFYDNSGRLEGMPLLAEDGKSVTVATQHFSSFFVSLVKLALLTPEIDSGFRPGKDDWQFDNRGSYLTPTGECAGQVLTEAWYYIERHLKGGASRLYGLYDNNGSEQTPQLWEDDSNGYRLASVAQSQLNSAWYVTKADQFFPKLRDLRLDTLQYDAVRYAIEVTGEPQLVYLWDSKGGNSHAILAYRVAPVGIFVADPNYPAAWRLIPFDPSSGKFGTYFSGVTSSAVAEGKGVSYTRFVYAAKTALVDWSAIAADWGAFDAGTIGTGLFPADVLDVLTGQDDQGMNVWIPLVDGYQTDNKKLTLRILGPHWDDQVRIKVYRGTSSTLAAPANRQVTIDLADGPNPLGIYEQGSKPAWPNWMYVDFLRLTVTLGPAESPGETCSKCWALTSTSSSRGGPGTFSVSDQTVNSTDGRMTSAGTFDEAGVQGHSESSTSWGPPPATAVPGGTWTTTLSAEATSSDNSVLVQVVNLRATAHWTGGGGVAQTKEWSVYANSQTGAESKDLSWAFPAPYPASGAKVEIDLNGGADTWTYRYEWQP